MFNSLDHTLFSQKILAAAALVVLLSFIFVAFLGLSFSMPRDMAGNMTNCPWSNTASAVCPMNVNEHIASWQQLFAVNPRPDALLAFFVILSAVIILFVIEKLEVSVLFVLYYRRYKQQHPAALFNYLGLIFARGILQPKLYA